MIIIIKIIIMIMMIIEMMIAIRIAMMMMIVMSNMMHLYYESGAVAVDRSATSSCMNRTRRSYR